MIFSVIIPVKEITNSFRSFIKHFEKQNFKDFEILVLSDIDEKDKFPKTRIIKTGKVPPSRKRNIGALKSRGEILAFIDDDAFPANDWLKVALKDFKDKSLSAIGGPSLVPPKATFFQRVSNKVYELSSKKTGSRYGLKKSEEIDDWPTCNFFVRKKDFESVEGFDSNFWGGEDTQLCYSLIKKNKKIIYDPLLKIFHHPRKNLVNHLKQSFFWGMWRGFFMKIHPKNSRQLVFFIPFLFTFGIILGGIVSLFSRFILNSYLVIWAFYLIYLTSLGIRTKNIKLAVPVIFVTILTHFAYGFGFFRGIISGSEGPIKKGMHSKENLI